VRVEAVAVNLLQALKPLPLLWEDGCTASPGSVNMHPDVVPENPHGTAQHSTAQHGATSYVIAPYTMPQFDCDPRCC
jgi:hypothetical protein